MVKPGSGNRDSNRVPSARDGIRTMEIAITSAIKYEVWTHDTSLELADNPAGIWPVTPRRSGCPGSHEHPEHHDEERKQPSRRDVLAARGALIMSWGVWHQP